MAAIIVDFETLKQEAIDETYELFSNEHPSLILDLTDAIRRINEEILYHKYLIKDIEKQIKLGLSDDAVIEAKERRINLMNNINLIRHDPETGYRLNSVNYGGGVELSNDYCRDLFLANVNGEIISRLTVSKTIDEYAAKKRDKMVKGWALYYVYAIEAKEIALPDKKRFQAISKEMGSGENALYQSYLSMNNEIERKKELINVKTGKKTILFCIEKLKESHLLKSMQLAENEYRMLFPSF